MKFANATYLSRPPQNLASANPEMGVPWTRCGEGCLMYFYITENNSSLYQQIANGLKPGGRIIVEDVGQPVMEKLLQAKAKWEPTGLQLLRLEYLEGLNEWANRPGPLGRLLLQKPS